MIPGVKVIPIRWQTVTTVAPLAHSQLHIWQIELKDNYPHLDSLNDWLSNFEANKIKRIINPIKARRQIQSRAWLRWLLGNYCHCKPQNIHYRYGDLGKPFLPPELGYIHFNASDSGTTLVCTFAIDNELGIDVEAIPRNVDFKRIAEKKFTSHEQEQLFSLPETQQRNAFLALWTRKEAYGKAKGVGIRYPMSQITLSNTLDDASFQFTDHLHAEKTWHLQQVGLHNAIACIVSEQSVEHISLFKLDIDRLIP